ncbi:MAG: AI-2E family transporter, partial [Eubacteriaceae bacterium]|nr:AI-2E family transporter [Eubacteriaceae bacterium]
MKNVLKDEKKVFRYFWAAVLGVCLIIAFYQVSSDLPKFLGWLRKVLERFVKVITPIVVGSVIAYLLKNPGRKIKGLLMKSRFFSSRPKGAHTVSVLMTSFLAMALLVGFLFAVIPNTVDSITLLISRMTDLRTPLERIYYRLARNELFVRLMSLFHIDIAGSDPTTLIMDLIGMGQKYLSNIGTYIYSFALDTGAFLYNFVI